MTEQPKTGDVYTRVTSKIIEQLEKGVVPWHQPWCHAKARETHDPHDIWPRNALSNHYYSGSNVLMTWMHMAELGIELGQAPPLFLTYKQAKAAGGHVLKGSKGCVVIAYNLAPNKPSDDEEDGKPSFRRGAFASWVFHISQVHLPDEVLAKFKSEPSTGLVDDKTWQTFVGATKAKIVHGGTRAGYQVGNDTIWMPAAKSFDTPDHYKNTVFHELTHWTGHPSRLKRDMSSMHNVTGYAFEELVAELGAAFLCAKLGISITELRHADYLAGWLKALKGDKKFIVQAASKAKAATDYIVNLSQEALNAHTAETKARKPKARQDARPKQPRRTSGDDGVNRSGRGRRSVADRQRAGNGKRQGVSRQA